MNRIKQAFQNRTEKVIPFLTAGYPSKEDTLKMVLAAEKGGAAMVELGIPYSDPLADGPIIQESSQAAIKSGVTIDWILQTVAEIRKTSEIPMALMGYINPIINFGLTAFMAECREVGVDGLIIPDLPPEEAGEYLELARQNVVSPILLVAPNSSRDRIKEISTMAGDIIYCVSTLGVTGSNNAVRDKLSSYLKKVGECSKCPFVVGFGIKDRLGVIEINQMAHGAVVGSAIIKELKISVNPVETVKNYIEKLTT